jgi:ribonuclease P protein component
VVPAAENADRGERGSFRFTREERLKGRNEIREVFSRGRRFGCRSVNGLANGNARGNTAGGGAKLFVLKNNLPRSRICFTFSRGFGNAVERNRARRLGREAYRHLRPRLAAGFDLILLVYPGGDNSETLVSRTAQLEFLFAKAGLLK